MVLRQKSVASIDHEHQHLGFLDRQAHLPGGEHVHGLLDPGQAPGIDHHERPVATAAHAIVAIAGDAGHVGHQRVAAARQYIEKGRFTNVGATDQSDDGQHG